MNNDDGWTKEDKWRRGQERKAKRLGLKMVQPALKPVDMRIARPLSAKPKPNNSRPK